MPNKQAPSKTSTDRASSVKLSYFPNWLLQLLKAEYPKESRWPPEDDFNYFLRTSENLFGKIGIDHWGTTTWYGVSNCFVTEPYGVDAAAVELLKQKGREREFVVVHDPIAYHNPGPCQRVLIFPRYLSPFKNYEAPVLKAIEEMGFEITGKAPKSKQLAIIENTNEDKEAFESFVKDRLRLSTISLFMIPFVVKTTADGFKFLCSKQKAYKLKIELNTYKRWMSARIDKSNMPLLEIEVVDDKTLIGDRENTFDSNTGLFVDALRLKFVLTASIQAVEEVLKKELGDKLVGIAQGEPNKYDERHLTLRLSEPISKKVASGLVTQLKPKIALIPTCGHFEIPW